MRDMRDMRDMRLGWSRCVDSKVKATFPIGQRSRDEPVLSWMWSLY